MKSLRSPVLKLLLGQDRPRPGYTRSNEMSYDGLTTRTRRCAPMGSPSADNSMSMETSRFDALRGKGIFLEARSQPAKIWRTWESCREWICPHTGPLPNTGIYSEPGPLIGCPLFGPDPRLGSGENCQVERRAALGSGRCASGCLPAHSASRGSTRHRTLSWRARQARIKRGAESALVGRGGQCFVYSC